nr:polymorphic outer membrane protein middle domain-containing protein [Chlamydia pneumoniae]
MRPIHFSLLSTALCCSLSGNEVSNPCSYLDSKSSISGFRSSNPLDGFSYDTSQGLQISNNFAPTIFAYQSYGTSGASISCKTLLVSNNTGVIRFENNFCMGEGGAIYAVQSCTFTKNRDLIFKTNTANVTAATNTNSTGLGGAIRTQTLNIVDNFGRCVFENNKTQNNAGAVYASENLSITGNRGCISVKHNTTITGVSTGGGLWGKRIDISNNSQPIQITDNSAGQAGGIYTSVNATISGNKEIIEFRNNIASSANNTPNLSWNPGGGAIMSNAIVIENNPKGIIFSNNQAARNGGAIYSRSLIIKNNGPVAFINNSATWGGALLNLSSGSGTPNFFLSADYGDIIFNNNLATKNAPSLPSYRNAIHCTPGINLKIGASQGHKVIFYDAIEHEHTTSNPIVFNYEPHHHGTVVFSGINLDPDATDESNFLSKLSNSSRLERGVLAIEDRAIISCKIISQTGGLLRLGNAASVRTNTTASSINFNAIAINLPSVLQAEALAPKFWIYPTKTGSTYSEDTSSNMSLSGPLTFLNEENESPYDSLDLSEPLKEIPILYLLDVAAKNIDTSNLIVEAINLDEHYGHQGLWSPYWMETTTTTSTTIPEQTNTNHRQLYVDWTPVGYRPNPERHGEFIANTLWQSAYNALLGIRILPPQNLKEHDLEASLQGLGLLINQHNGEGRKGFRNHTTGYAATTSAKTCSTT